MKLRLIGWLNGEKILNSQLLLSRVSSLLGYDAHALSSQISEGSTKKGRKSGNGN